MQRTLTTQVRSVVCSSTVLDHIRILFGIGFVSTRRGVRYVLSLHAPRSGLGIFIVPRQKV